MTVAKSLLKKVFKAEKQQFSALNETWRTSTAKGILNKQLKKKKMHSTARQKNATDELSDEQASAVSPHLKKTPV